MRMAGVPEVISLHVCPVRKGSNLIDVHREKGSSLEKAPANLRAQEKIEALVSETNRQ